MVRKVVQLLLTFVKGKNELLQQRCAGAPKSQTMDCGSNYESEVLMKGLAGMKSPLQCIFYIDVLFTEDSVMLASTNVRVDDRMAG